MKYDHFMDACLDARPRQIQLSVLYQTELIIFSDETYIGKQDATGIF